jgi:hypothetical protein
MHPVIVTVIVDPQIPVISAQDDGQEVSDPPLHEQTESAGKLGAAVESVGQSPTLLQHWPRSWL